MSGPGSIEVLSSRRRPVGGLSVLRALPQRTHRTVGAWCFADHFGPTATSTAVEIGPHPHIGLQTVTWLLDGELLHRDSLGSEQVVRAGQLNLMTAGHGVAHAEDSTGRDGPIHGVQLWVAQPDRSRNGEPAFEHHAELPMLELERCVATVLVGELGGCASAARRDTEHLGVDLALRSGCTELGLDTRFEHALMVLDGSLVLDGHTLAPGHVAVVGPGRDALALDAPDATRALLLGGEPFEAPITMWWNFVARTDAEIDAAAASWRDDDGRFGPVVSTLQRIAAPRRAPAP